MKQKNRHLTLGTTISIGTWLMLCPAAFAQIIPGPADVGRIRPEETLPPPDHSNDREVALPSFVVTTTIPEAAKEIHFILKEIRLDGMTAFTAQQLADIYAPYMGREVTLDVAWMIAGAITERYRNAGYFLSRAYLPPQEIDNGVITIKVTEGYVGKVDMPEDIRASRVVRAYISRLLAQRPLTSDAMERFLLLLNDLPGYAFSGTLSPLEGADEGAVRLTLVPVPKESKGSIGFDNYSSRYLGPSEFSASYSTSLLPLQQTTLTGLSSACQQIALRHRRSFRRHSPRLDARCQWRRHRSLSGIHAKALRHRQHGNFRRGCAYLPVDSPAAGKPIVQT